MTHNKWFKNCLSLVCAAAMFGCSPKKTAFHQAKSEGAGLPPQQATVKPSDLYPTITELLHSIEVENEKSHRPNDFYRREVGSDGLFLREYGVKSMAELEMVGAGLKSIFIELRDGSDGMLLCYGNEGDVQARLTLERVNDVGNRRKQFFEQGGDGWHEITSTGKRKTETWLLQQQMKLFLQQTGLDELHFSRIALSTLDTQGPKVPVIRVPSVTGKAMDF